MVSLLITLIVYLVVLGLLWWVVGMLPIPAKFKQVIDVAFVLLAILLILSLFFGGGVPLVRTG